MVSQITTISIMMVLPALGGYYLDQYLGTVALFFFLGMLLGIVSAGYQFYKLIEYRNRQLEEEIKREHRVNNSEPRL